MHRFFSFYFAIFLILTSTTLFAKEEEPTLSDLTEDASLLENNTEYSMSILTCGKGSELYASFGHTAIRIQEKNSGLDRVYNYGVFNFSDPKFYQKFTLGKLDYYLDTSSYDNFINEYEYYERQVKEQQLDLPQAEIESVVNFLNNNLLPENKYYRYDFTEDNCATRVRDIFPEVLGINFLWGEILNNKRASYRHAINLELGHNPWARFGINLLLGSTVDKTIDDDQIMFLPIYLEEGLKNAKYRMEPLVKETKIVQDKQETLPLRINGPLWMNIGILLLTALSFHVRIFSYLKPIIRFFLLFSVGALGCIMLFMWIFTNHEQCAANYNILWAVPIHIVIAFVAHKRTEWMRIFSLLFISLLMVAFIIHLIGIQILPLIEIAPLLLALMYIYIDMYKSSSGSEVSSAVVDS